MESFTHSVETRKGDRLIETYAGHPHAQTENKGKDLMQENKAVFKLPVIKLKVVTETCILFIFFLIKCIGVTVINKTT